MKQSISLPAKSRLLTPERLFGFACVAHYRATETDYADSPYLADQNMERLNTTAWTAANATISKSAANPYAGYQCLRVAYSSAASGSAYQTTLTSGKTYAISGVFRSGDGVSIPKLGTGNAFLAVGTTSTEWQSFSIVSSVSHTQLHCYSTGMTSANSYCEFDNLRVEMVLVDANCDSDGYADWTAGGGATLSKIVQSSGKSLRISGNQWAYASQDNMFIIGQCYRIRGKIKGNGTCAGAISDTGSTWYSSTTSTDWQSFDVAQKAAGTKFAVYQTTNASGYVEIDDIVIERISVSALKDLSAKTSAITITDANMEADGYAAWTFGSDSGGSMQKIAGGKTGSKCIRVSCTASYSYASQPILTIGKTYRIRAWAKSNGTATPKVYLGNVVWTGTTSTEWQYCSAIGVQASSTSFSLLTNGVGYCDFDDVQIDEIIDNTLVQATATKMPAKIENNGNTYLAFDGADDFLQKAFTLAQPYTILVSANWTKQADSRYLIDGLTTNSGGIYHGAANTAIQIYSSSAGYSGALFTDATWGIIDVSFNGASSTIGYQGASTSGGTVGAGTAGGLTVGSVGAGTGFFATAKIREIVIINRAITAFERNEMIKVLKCNAQA